MLWGDEAHVRRLLGNRVTDVVAARHTVRVDRFATPEAFRDYFKANYGPVVAVCRSLGDDEERVASLDRDLADLARISAIGPESSAMEWEYLLVTARRTG